MRGMYFFLFSVPRRNKERRGRKNAVIVGVGPGYGVRRDMYTVEPEARQQPR
jgi:hypothetical protein